MAITKTDFMRGMQCPKMLWLDKHKPSLKVIPPEIQEKLDAGNDFGDRAMGMFGPLEQPFVCRLHFGLKRQHGVTLGLFGTHDGAFPERIDLLF